jgi:hypothetical protein
MRTVIGLLIAIMLSEHASAQTPGQFQGGANAAPLLADTANGRPGLNDTFAKKADASGGVLTNPTLRGGTASGVTADSTSSLNGSALNDPSGNIVIRLGNAGTNPTWYAPTGARGYAPLAISDSPWGFGNQAQSLSVYTNQTQQQTDYGCSAGGFGENIENRGYAAVSDLVSVCHLINSTTPLATLTSGTDYQLVNDPAVTVPQYQTLNEGGARQLTGINSVATKIQFTVPLSTQQVAALRVNMFVRTGTGWTGFVKSWDPNGAWVTVDTWVSIVNPGVGNGSTAFVGYNPLANWTAPTGALLANVVLYINAMQNTYGINGILNHNPGGYCLFGFGCSAEYLEFGTANNIMPFVRNNEYDWASDQPRDVGALLGSGGTYTTSAGIVIAGANVDKGFVVSDSQYAAFLAQPHSQLSQNHPYGDGFMSQQTSADAFSIKHAGAGYIYQVDALSGTVQQGQQGTSVSTVRGTVSLQSTSTSTQVLTRDGALPATNGVNLPISIPPQSLVNLVAELTLSDATAGAVDDMQIRCIYKRIGTAAPTVVGSASVQEVPSTPNANYANACSVDGTNSYGEIVVSKTTSGAVNWIASFTATVSPL